MTAKTSRAVATGATAFVSTQLERDRFRQTMRERCLIQSSSGVKSYRRWQKVKGGPNLVRLQKLPEMLCCFVDVGTDSSLASFRYKADGRLLREH
jgi:hypothetical protein